MAFRGQYEHSLDSKNRLAIPARFRSAFASGLVLAKDIDACLAVWTPERHEAVVERALGELNPMAAQYRKLARYFQGNSYDMELDSAGRITLGPKLLEHAGIQKEVTVVGVGDHLEIWDRARWLEGEAARDAEIEEVTELLGNPS